MKKFLLAIALAGAAFMPVTALAGSHRGHDNDRGHDRGHADRDNRGHNDRGHVRHGHAGPGGVWIDDDSDSSNCAYVVTPLGRTWVCQ